MSARIHTLDVLRGTALFGMILVHFHQRPQDATVTGTGTWLEEIEQAIGWIVWIGAEQKFWAMFAFLFGVGFALQLRRAEARGDPIAAFYLRRLGVLALFGVAAHVLFGFTVLVGYAVWGVPLLLVRRWSTRSLLIAAAVSALCLPVYQIAAGAYEWALLGREGADAAMQARTQANGAAWAAFRQAAAQESYGAVLAARLDSFPLYYWRAHFWIPGGTLVLFLLGFVALRHGVFDDPRRHVGLIVGAMLAGLVSWAAYWLLLPMVPTDYAVRQIATQIRYGLGIVSDPWLTFTYMGAIVLLLAYRPAWERKLAPAAWAGRMALTNYLLQIALLDVLFSRHGLELPFREALVPVATIALFGMLAVFSRWWLTRYRAGPAEWLWRSLSHGRLQPMRAVRSAPAALGL